ncbi:MAG: hypothetical protein Q3962_05165 [Corynebacterium sp.]|nr:hypothetical protein [Corynebacterium sp.]
MAKRTNIAVGGILICTLVAGLMTSPAGAEDSASTESTQATSQAAATTTTTDAAPTTTAATTTTATTTTTTTVAVTTTPTPTSINEVPTSDPVAPTALAGTGFHSEARLGLIPLAIYTIYNIVWDLLPLKYFTNFLRMTTSDARGLFDTWTTDSQQQYCQDVADGKYTLEEQINQGYSQHNIGLDGCRDGKVADGRSSNLIDWFKAWGRFLFKW